MKDVHKLKPIGDRVLVKQKEAISETKGGIVIPDHAKKKPMEGDVIAVGPGLNGKPMVVKVGDHVVFGQYAGTRIEVNEGEEYLLMREADIFIVDEN